MSRVLRRIGALAFEPLIASLTQGDDRIRGKAVTALGRIGEERAIDALTNALQDKSISVRIKAVYVLGKFDEMAEKGLEMALEDNAVSVRRAARRILTIHRLGSPASITQNCTEENSNHDSAS